MAEEWLQHRRQLFNGPLAPAHGAGRSPSAHKVESPPMTAAWPKTASKRHRRPHVLRVELDELRLNSGELALELAWYESARYFVSLHPSSVKLPTVQWPREAPRPQPHAQYMASMPQAATSSEPEVYEQQEQVHFKEKLEMRVDRLDSHFILFLWCTRSGLLSEATVLLGYRPIPLRDASLYSRWAAWDIFDLQADRELAQLSIRLDVEPPPAQIRLPHLSDVKETKFTLNWSPPLGSEPTAYAVSLRSHGAAVASLRQTTSSREVCFDGLVPGCSYVLEVKGMNQAGWGDSCQLEASTRPRREGRGAVGSPGSDPETATADNSKGDALHVTPL